MRGHGELLRDLDTSAITGVVRPVYSEVRNRRESTDIYFKCRFAG